MPIGWSSNLAGATSRAQADARNRRVRQSLLEQVATISISVVDDFMTIAHRVIEAEAWTRWETASDERVCPVCGPYAGRVWRADDGPRPPLHPNCRCQRVFAYTTWTVRD